MQNGAFRVATFLRSSELAHDPHLLILNGDAPHKAWIRKVLDIGPRWTLTCADGGSNRLHDALQTDEERRNWCPRWVCGDLDSVRDSVRDKYEAMGTFFDRMPEQDRNDFEKCLEKLRKETEESDCERDVVVIGWNGDRLDHELANLHVAYRHVGLRSLLRVYLLNERNVSFFLQPGQNRIVLDLEVEGPDCGLLPLGEKCGRVSTRGLKWNLKEEPLEFGVFVSSSNRVVEPLVEIETSGRLLWTCQLRI